MSEQGTEIDATLPTCRRCGAWITQRYAGTFWKAPDPMPMVWVHLMTDDRACGYAEPNEGGA